MMTQEDKEKDSHKDKIVPESTPDLCHLCFDALLAEVAPGATMARPTDPPPAVECPLFVTWSTRRRARRPPSSATPPAAVGDVWELRGCVGTLSPRPLGPALAELACSAALRDQRFPPVSSREVPRLRAGVSLLIGHEVAADCLDWDVGVHGIAIAFQGPDEEEERGREAAEGSDDGGGPRRSYTATYLPEVAREQGWTQREAVASLVAKAGYRGPVTEGLLARIRCTRYRSSKSQATYQEYVTARAGNDHGTVRARGPQVAAVAPCIQF